MDFYGKNQQAIPEIAGEIIPEFIQSEAEYQQKILKPMYKAISAHDRQGILQNEWLNSRAAIPKFAYKAIEIRILDSQECVQADIAIALAIRGDFERLAASFDLLFGQSLRDPALKKGL